MYVLMEQILAFLFFLTTLAFSAHFTLAGVIGTQEIIANGKKNLADPLFSGKVNFDDRFGDEVQYILTDDKAFEQTVKVDILRSALTAQEHLPEAVFSLDDVSSRKLYESLVMYDLVSQYGLFSNDERIGLKKIMTIVLAHYLSPKQYDWSDDFWNLGAAAMRIAASCALYSLNFPEDPNSARYLEHAVKYCEKNINDSIDDFGGWLTDSPGYLGEVMEYMFVTAKALKGKGVKDYFSEPRLVRLFLQGIHLLPPQQSPLIGGKYLSAGRGRTNPHLDHSASAVIAAGDLYHQFPDEASYLIWYWKQCGNPVTPLGLLFIDTSIPYMRPEGVSMTIGAGTVVFRDHFNTPEENFIVAEFGPPWGIPDREDDFHSDSGDFSFIWSGMPITFHSGFSEPACSEALFTGKAYRHNLVLFEGAGDTPVLPDSEYSDGLTFSGGTRKTAGPADFYPNGICQFLSTGKVDYAAGPVRLEKTDLPALIHYRHFLYLKPDALLVWDQIESPYPLEWNLWMPVKSADSVENRLKIQITDDVELNAYFAGDTMLDYTVEDPPTEFTGTWPLIMEAEYGKGLITVVSIDLSSPLLGGASNFGRNVLHNLLSQREEPKMACLITDNNNLKRLLNELQINLNHVEPGEIAVSDLTGYDILIIDLIHAVKQKHDLDKLSGAIHTYLSGGGNVLWFCHSPLPMKSGTIASPGLIPILVEYSGCVTPLDKEITPRNDITISSGSVWSLPNYISPDDWHHQFSALLTKIAAGGNDYDFTIHLPSSWSDAWTNLVSVKMSIPIQSPDPNESDVSSRIRVRHPASKDFFTLLLPVKSDEPNVYTVTKHETGHIVFGNPVTTWDVKAGKTSWTDANLSVMITRDGKQDALYAFDCTTATVGTEKISSESPLSLWYSFKDDSGAIMTRMKNTVKFGRGTMKLHAGEVRFKGLKSSIALERETFLTTLIVTDDSKEPLQWARVSVNGRCLGSTDPQGAIPVRWKDTPPDAVVRFGGTETYVKLQPGDITIQLSK